MESRTLRISDRNVSLHYSTFIKIYVHEDTEHGFDGERLVQCGIEEHSNKKIQFGYIVKYFLTCEI